MTSEKKYPNQRKSPIFAEVPRSPGKKSDIIENEEYSRFCDAMRKFIQEVMIPRLSEIEVRRMNVAELRVLKKVNKALGKAITEVLAGASVQG